MDSSNLLKLKTCTYSQFNRYDCLGLNGCCTGPPGPPGPPGPQGPSGESAVGSNNVASYYSSQTQVISDTSATVFSYNATFEEQNISLVGGTQITVQKEGYYEAWYSIQAYYDGTGSTANLYVWLRKNGIDVPNSNGTIENNSNNKYNLPIVPYILKLNAGDYLEFVAQGSDEGYQALYESGVSIPGPALPSIIVGIKEVATDIGAPCPPCPPCPANEFTLFNQMNRDEITSAQSPYTPIAGQYFIAVTSLSAPLTINLPTANTTPNNFYVIADESGQSSTYPITINTQSGETLSGSPQMQINVAYGNVWIYSVQNTTKYFVLFTRP
jgi:hypothetical protein